MAKKNTAPQENTQTKSMSGDVTRIADLAADITQLNGKLVPVLQINSGPDQGKILSLGNKTEIFVGRANTCEISVQDPSCSRRHARIFIAPDGRVFVEDLNSTNGSKINGKRVEGQYLLQDGDNLQFGDNTRVKFALSLEQDAQVQMDVYHRATRDMLTNAYNRRRFEETLEREMAFLKRGQATGLGLIMFDVDFFKKVNDTHGHLAGDALLKEIGLRIPELIRKEDIFARYGGEEFAILTRNETLDGLKILAERIRHDFESRNLVYEDKTIAFTVSIGVTYITKEQDCPEKDVFIKAADDALYEAKHNGRNQVRIKTFLNPT
ncbi:MAG: GGDEF domain-containing protein [Proteobacteria bacterium]|nr:GGDEF domain-containing protein [Pseudomonadota bacterium]